VSESIVTDTDPVPAEAFPNNTVRIVELPEPSVTPAVVNTSFPKRPLNSNVPLSNVTGAVPTPLSPASASDPVPTLVKETAPPSDPANVVVAALATVSSAGETELIPPPIPVNVPTLCNDPVN
jgi:hypothetical protein